jgi:membrane-associated protease RseP (regulator of RpoE activity)
MQRSLSLGGVAVLIVALMTGLTFGNTPAPTRSLTSAGPASSSSFTSIKGGKKGGNKKSIGKKRKPGKPKPGKKTGNKKKNKKKKHHKNHHHKKHKKHKKHKDDGDDGDEGGSGGDVGGGDMGGGDVGGGDVGGGDPSGPEIPDAVEPALRAGHALLITDLEPDGPAATAGLDVDDTILSVNGVRVQSVEELRAVVEKATGPVSVVYISDDTGDVEDADIVPLKGRLGITMDVVTVDEAQS